MDHGTQKYGTAHGMSWSPHYGDIPAPLLIIHHTYRPLVFTINDVGMASGVPHLVPSCNRAAYPALALRREVPRAQILAAPALPGRAKLGLDRRLLALRSLAGLLVLCLAHLLELEHLERELYLAQVLLETLDRVRQLLPLDLCEEHRRHVLTLPHREALDELLLLVEVHVVVVADELELPLLISVSVRVKVRVRVRVRVRVI